MTLYERLKEPLARGFYPDNLVKIAQLAEEASWQADSPLGLYTLARTLNSLYDDWTDGSEVGDQGIHTKSAEAMTRLMEPPIRAYIEACAEGRTSPDEQVPLLDDIVRSFLKWRTSEEYSNRLPRF